MEVLIGLVIWLACGVVGAMIMSGRGRSSCGGFALGILLGPIGLIIALLIRPSEEHEAERQLRIEEMKDTLRERAHDRQRRRDDDPNQLRNRLPSQISIEGERSYFRWKCSVCNRRSPWMQEGEVEIDAANHVCK